MNNDILLLGLALLNFIIIIFNIYDMIIIEKKINVLIKKMNKNKSIK